MSQIYFPTSGSGGGGVTSVTGGTGITATPTTGAVVVSLANNEYFSAYLSNPTGNVTGDSTTYDVVFDQTVANTSSSYNTSNGHYTAPSNGFYTFSCTISFFGGDALTTDYLLLWDGSSFSSRAFQVFTTASASNLTTILSATTGIISMTAGQQIKIGVNVNGTNRNVEVYGSNPYAGTGVFNVCSFFSGMKIG
jgi:C1q domain